MPKSGFDLLARNAALQGTLRLTQGGVSVDMSRSDQIVKSLRDVLKLNPDGTVQEHGDRTDLDFQTAQMLRRARQARLAAAQATMERAWNKMGGPKSRVGLPVSSQITVTELGPFGHNGYAAQFRGGTITLSGDGSTASTDKQTVVSIDVVGIECQIRQEKTDEIYGVISVLGPSNNTILSRRIPDGGTISMGPDGMRISQIHVPLINRQVLQNYYIWAALVENDSGDVNVIAKQVADKFADTANAAIGALTGTPAEAVSDSESFKQNIATGFAWIFGNVLGMGDDPYNAESFSLFWGDLKNTPPSLQPAITRNDDPRRIEEWTHKLTLSGVDDGGDRGQYAIYFKVWTEDQSYVVNVPTG